MEQHIRTGNIHAVALWLDQNPMAIDTPIGNENRTMLIYASWYGRRLIFDLLIERGSRAILTPDAHGSLPIHFAAQNNYVEIFRRVLDLTPVPAGDTLESSQKRHLAMLGAGGKSVLQFGSLSFEIVSLILRLAPETYQISDLKFIVSDQLLLTRTEQIIRLFIERVDTAIIRSSILHDDCSVLRILLFKDANLDLILDLVSLVRNELTPARLIPLILAASGRALDYLLQIDPEWINLASNHQIGQILVNAIPSQNPKVVDSILVQLSPVNRTKILMHSYPERSRIGMKRIPLKHAVERANPEVLWRIISSYLPVMEDPFLRGQIYGFIFVDGMEPIHSLFTISFQQEMSSELFLMLMHLLNLLAGPESIWIAMNTFNEKGDLPIHLAILRQSPGMVEACLRLGSPCIPTKQNPPRTLMDLAIENEAPDRLPIADVQAIKDILQAVDGSQPNLEIRHRIYFRDSLTQRLLWSC